MYGLKSSDIDSICKTLRHYPQVTEAIIYGSRAMGNYKAGSDVDISLYGKISFETVLNIAADLNERSLLPYKFDVISYSMIDYRPLKDHIDHYGKSFYNSQNPNQEA